MPKAGRPAWWRYGNAVGMTGIAALLRWALSPVLGYSAPFVFFVMAVTVTALAYGLGPALLVTVAGGMIAVFAWLLPAPLSSSNVLTNIIVYLLLCLFISILIELMRRARQRAEESAGSADESRKLLATTLGSIGDAVIATDLDARVTFLNPVAETLTGWPRGAAIGQPASDVFVIVNEQSRQTVESPITRVLREGIVVGLANHTVLIRKDGSEIPIDDSGAPIRDEQGQLSGVVLVFRDVSERRRVEEALSFVASIVETSDDAIIGKRLDGTIVSWNAGAERLYGYRPEEVIGKHIRLLADAADDDIDHIMEQLKSGKRIEHYETVRVKKNGERVNVALTISTIKGPAGTLTGASTIARDITERKRADRERERLMAELESQRTRLNNVVANVPGVVWEAWGEPDAASQRINYVSDYVETMLGYSTEEWQRTPNFWLTIVHPEDRERAARTAAENFAAGGGVNEFRWLTKDGRALWVETHDVVIYDEQGQPAGMRGVTMDISERKRAEEERARFLAATEASEQQARFLAAASATLASSLDYQLTLRRVAELAVPHLADWCIVHIAEDGKHLKQLAITHVDPKQGAWAEEIGLRYPPDPDAPHGVANILRTGRSEYYPEVDDALLAKMASDADHLELLRAAHLRSAMLVPLAARDRALGVMTFIASEAHAAYTPADLALAEDLARRAALAVDNALLFTEAHRARAEAENANRAKDEFLATVSHELRTPLNAIVGWSHMLRTRTFDAATTARALETIERNAKAQAQIVEDILDVSRIITGKLRLEVQPVDLAAIIDAALDSVRPAAEAKGIRLQAVLDPHAGPVSGDASRLQQVVWNLLSNAVKFTPRGGRIQVRLERADSQVEIVVADTGQGITPALLPYVFDRFRQGDSTSTRLHGGLGLGLAIVRHLVELHGGTVTAESSGEGQGSTFRVRMPLLPLHAGRDDSESVTPGAHAASPLQKAPELTGLKVLVVEDESDSRTLLQTMIEQFGAEVKVCASSAEAFAAFHEWLPDVLVSDIEMPGEDGYQMIRRIRELAPERGGKTPAVALTAYARADDRMRALAAGYQIHVAKPADPIELAVVIASLAAPRRDPTP
ncbi:MAG TPA: PAS domain S-box protein [Blastocatellia bacterium]|nr:PAS domain S-box protein [Blastocatellia bacterium]